MMLDSKKVRIQSLTQGTQEWLDYRLDKIGASEFASLAGVLGLTCNKFNSTYFSLLYGKLRNKYATYKSNYKSLPLEMGSVCEDLIREYLFVSSGIEAVPAVVTPVDSLRIFSSLDGIDLKNKILVEIKTSSHIHSEEDVKTLLHYYCHQVIHQLYSLGESVAPDGKIAIIAILNLEFFNGSNFEECISIYDIFKESDDFIVRKDSSISDFCRVNLSRSKWKDYCLKFVDDLDKLEHSLYVKRPRDKLELLNLKSVINNSDISCQINGTLLKIDDGGSLSLCKKYLKGKNNG
ncbi:MAG: hypothetical protein EKK61_05680 [Rickettsiales bacterium]|nr:MAG: hypothetical protein EKK61_05680 [Rickettsiales bacterium]